MDDQPGWIEGPLFSPLAFVLRPFEAFSSVGQKRRALRKELRRIAVSANFNDSPLPWKPPLVLRSPGFDPEYEWHGDVGVALEAVAKLPSGIDRDVFWRGLPGCLSIEPDSEVR
jgi:hypothetical protein